MLPCEATLRQLLLRVTGKLSVAFECVTFKKRSLDTSLAHFDVCSLCLRWRAVWGRF